MKPNNLCFSTGYGPNRSLACIVASLLALTVFFLPGTCAAYQISFDKVADESTNVPGGVGFFSFVRAFHAPVIDNGAVSFYALYQTEQAGIYTTAGGTLRTVANRNSINPVSGEEFDLVNSLHEPSLRAGKTAFWGKTRDSGSGVFVDDGGTLSIIADTGTIVPGKNFTFEKFVSVGISLEGNVAFVSRSVANASGGVYKLSNSTLTEVANPGDNMPGSPAAFTVFSDVTIHGEDVAFRGINEVNLPTSNFGIYTDRGGMLRKVADTSTIIPGGSGETFDSLFKPAIHENGITFTGSTQHSALGGVYIEENGSLRALVDTNTLVPGSSGDFDIGSYASDGKDVAFTDNLGQGLFFTDQDQVVQLIGPTDTLGGKTIQRIFLEQRGYEEGIVAFKAQFTDDTFAIYTATITVPEPTAWLIAMGAALLFLVGWRQHRSVC